QKPTAADTYNSQWAEVYYYMVATGASTSTNIPLFALYRGQYVVVADNSPVAGLVDYNDNSKQDYAEFSFRQDPDRKGKIFFNTPMDLADGKYSELGDRARTSTLLLSDVISFEVIGWNRDNWNLWQVNPSSQTWRYWDYIGYNSSQPPFDMDA